MSLERGSWSGDRRGNGGRRSGCTIWVGEGPQGGGGSAGAERSARSLPEMDGTNGETEGRKLCMAQLRFGWFGLGFFCGECASDTP